MSASITVKHKNGTRYDAQQLSVMRSYGRPVVVFQCSGGLTVFAADEMEAVEYWFLASRGLLLQTTQ